MPVEIKGCNKCGIDERFQAACPVWKLNGLQLTAKNLAMMPKPALLQNGSGKFTPVVNGTYKPGCTVEVV